MGKYLLNRLTDISYPMVNWLMTLGIWCLRVLDKVFVAVSCQRHLGRALDAQPVLDGLMTVS